ALSYEGFRCAKFELITKDGTLGKVAYVQGLKKPATLNTGIFNIEIKDGSNIDEKYLFQYLRAPFLMNYVAQKATGGTIKHLNQSILVNFPVVLPSLKEQEKIGKYFEEFDNLITLRQRKLEQQKKFKKYFLKNMFPTKEEKVPKIRLKGFTGDWTQEKLINICDYVDYRGKTPSKTTSGIFLVTAKNIKDGYIDYKASQEYISEKDYDKVMHRGMPKIGDVLITTEAPCGNVAQVNKENVALAQRIIKYRGHDHVMDNTYLKYYFLSPEFQNILYAKSSGGTVQGIKGSILHQQEVRFPRYEEQKKIGQYFDRLDTQTSHT
uniref:restriction endonuclease subunit S n=1 Tax=Mitsuokella sp. AF21-1AC TaxID=2292235 RepID=UPI0018F3684F